MIAPDDPRHGTRAGYVAGCRIRECCGIANQEYKVKRRADPYTYSRDLMVSQRRAQRVKRAKYLGEPTSMVDAAPVVEYVQKLLALGWPGEAISTIHAHLTGETDPINTKVISHLLTTSPTQVHRRTARLLEVPFRVEVPDYFADKAIVPNLGFARRREALLRMGHTGPFLKEALGFSHNSIETSAISTYTWRWRKMRDVYDELSMKPGSSRITADRAVRLGYAPPLAWDDIDDPTEVPQGHGPENRNLAIASTRADELRHAIHMGWNLEDVMTRLDISLDNLWKWCDRWGHLDLYDQISARTRTQENQSTVNRRNAS